MYEFSWGGVEVCSMPLVEGILLGQAAKTHFIASHNNESIETANELKISFFNVAAEVRKSEELSEKFFDPKFKQKVLDYSEALQKDYGKLTESFHEADFEKLDSKALLDQFNSFYDWMVRSMNAYQVTQPEFLHAPAKRLKEIIAARPKLELEKTFAELTAYTKLDAINNEEIAFGKIMQNGASQSAFLAHIGQFPWIMLNTYGKAQAVDFLMERAKAIPEEIEKKTIAQKKLLEKRQNEILKTLADKEAQYLAGLFQDLAFMRVEEKTCWASAVWNALPLYKEISTRYGEGLRNLIEVYRKNEVEELIVKGKQLPRQSVLARRKYYLFHFKHPKTDFYEGEEAIAKAVELGVDQKPQNLRQISGMCASPGKATGKVKIIITHGLGEFKKELEEFQEGDILVTGMTQITMVPICRKAAAIVTNEGGVTSHAAIISRELGIPCVIGTHVATRELKNGERVEVDATKGIVRRLD